MRNQRFRTIRARRRHGTTGWQPTTEPIDGGVPTDDELYVRVPDGLWDRRFDGDLEARP